jgi:membrane protein implicated in regulation of membrane protease activity
MDLLIAEIGAGALWLTYLWLAAAIAASYLSARKGYGEKLGLAFGLLLSVIGVLIWLIWPPKPDSRWKLQGVFGSKGKTVAELRAEQHAVRGD